MINEVFNWYLSNEDDYDELEDERKFDYLITELFYEDKECIKELLGVSDISGLRKCEIEDLMWEKYDKILPETLNNLYHKYNIKA